MVLKSAILTILASSAVNGVKVHSTSLLRKDKEEVNDGGDGLMSFNQKMSLKSVLNG